MRSKFGQMRPLFFMATDRVTVGKTASSRLFRTLLIGFIYILAGNDEIHKSLNDFEIPMDYGVGCP